MKLTKNQREQVRNRYGGCCAYCGCALAKVWHADHLLPVERNSRYDRDARRWVADGMQRPQHDSIENLMPSCPRCNISKHSLDLDSWRLWLQGHVRSLGAHHTPYKLARAYGLIVETGAPVIFYFEKIK